MIRADEDALVCDLAETYHILDYRQLPLTQVAVFSCGLREDSRIRMAMASQRVSNDLLLLARITDAVNLLLWTKTDDAETGKNRPESIAEALLGNSAEVTDKVVFASGEDFEAARRRLIKGDVD